MPRHTRARRQWLSILAAPFAAWAYLLAIWAGARTLTTPAGPLAVVLPGWEVTAAAAATLAGGTVALVGLLTRRPRAERAGLGLLVAGLGIYGATLLALGHTAGLVQGLTDLTYAAAAGVRAYAVGLTIRARRITTPGAKRA